MHPKTLQLFLLILVLAAGLRFAGITFDSLWLDEGYQSMADAVGEPLPDFASLPGTPYLFKFGPPRALSEVLGNFRRVDPLCPPLYAVTLNRWMTLFGDGDLAVRALSVLFSLASLSVVFFVSRRFFGDTAAVLATLLQAVSPFDIVYAQEARMYTLSMFMSALSGGSMLALISPGGRKTRLAWLPVYVVSTWALINAHYTGLFIPLFQGAFGVIYCLAAKRYRLLAVLTVAWSAILLLWLPWFELFKQAASVRTASFYVARKPSLWWPLWAVVGRIPFNWIAFLAGKRVVAYAVPLYATSGVFMAMAALATLPAASLPVLKRFMPTGGGPAGVTLPALFLWCWAIVPALAVWLLDVIEGHRVVEIARYLIATAPAVYILAGVGLAAYAKAGFEGRRWHPVKVLLIAHLFFALVNNAYAHAVPQREPWREMAERIESQCAADDLLIVSQPYDIVCLDRYLSRPFRQIGVTPALGAEHLARVLSGNRRFWLITAQEGEAIKDMVPSRYQLVSRLDLHHALHLRLYEDRRNR